MAWMLDTNICIYIIKQKPEKVLNHFKNIAPGEIYLSSITLAELEYGVRKSKYPKRNLEALNNFLIPLIIVPFDIEQARDYGFVRAALELKGSPIGPLDNLITAHAKSLGCILVTNNEKEFGRVEDGLQIENWAKD